MRRYSIGLFGFLAAALAVTPPMQGPAPATKPLASLAPPGALLYLEARDFGALVRDWNDSREKKAWLESDNYEVFSRSRLFLRLSEARDQFAAAAGLPPDMALVESVAGSESALALYDIGNLEFLYITRMPSAHAMENALWQARQKFEPRAAAELPYYVRAEKEKHRLVAFGTAGDLLLLATREDLIAGALSHVTGRQGPSLNDERWFLDAAKGGGNAGDLRLALNLEALVRTPHFRSYWIQRNTPDLRKYSAEVADLYRSPTEMREERIFLRAQQGNASGEVGTNRDSGGAALADVLRFVGDDAGLYRAWTSPAAAFAVDLLQRKVLAPHQGPGGASQNAPSVALTEGQVGSEGDLETRIDVPPLEHAGGAFGPSALASELQSKKLNAVLQVQSSRLLAGNVFVGMPSAVVIKADSDWDGKAVRTGIASAVESLWTTSQIGANWVEQKKSGATYYEFDGIAPLAVATQGRYLIVANSVDLVLAILGRMVGSQPGPGGVYAAGFRHARERGNIVKMMSLIETPVGQSRSAGRRQEEHEPLFFSENLASLSQSLGRVESESIVVRDQGPVMTQTVTYRMSR